MVLMIHDTSMEFFSLGLEIVQIWITKHEKLKVDEDFEGLWECLMKKEKLTSDLIWEEANFWMQKENIDTTLNVGSILM